MKKKSKKSEGKKKELLFSLTKKDFKVERMRGSSPGGQKRNVTDSAVRITHEPSETSTYSCKGRSQHANKAEAFRNLVEKPSFKKWLDVEIARRTGVIDEIKRSIEKSLEEHNIRTEIQSDGKWVEAKEGCK